MSRRGIPRSARKAAHDERNAARSRSGARPGATPRSHRPAGARRPTGARAWILAGVAALAVIALGIASMAMLGGFRPAGDGTVVQGRGGQWTNVTPDRLATMLVDKDFTLLNVKTPYSGEIARTDLWIPYDQLAAHAAELPADRAAKVVVYCRSGHESAIAAQTLLDLGYTNVVNLDGGMTAWTASGRQLLSVNRSGG